MKVLTIDVGGTHVKFLASGQKEKREFNSGKHLTPAKMVREVLERTGDWDYEAVSVGYPGLADHKGPRAEPENLGGGWVGFDFAVAFGKPVKVLNDAAMQALGSYEGPHAVPQPGHLRRGPRSLRRRPSCPWSWGSCRSGTGAWRTTWGAKGCAGWGRRNGRRPWARRSPR
jgi:hypothetical protein